MIPRGALTKIQDSIHRGNCCLVVGPRFHGKSKLVRKAAEELAKTGYYRITYISMGEITRADTRQFYRTLYSAIDSQITGRSMTIQLDVHSANDFRNAMLELMRHMGANLLLLVDDLELAPPNLISLLMSSIRSVFTTLANQPGARFQAIVSGTITPHQLALKGVSRFESISDLILVDDMGIEDSRIFVRDLFFKEGIDVSTGGLDAFLEQTGNDQILIRLLTGMCIRQIRKQKLSELTPDLLPGAVTQIFRQPLNYEVKASLNQIENDPDLLSCFLEISQRGEMQMNELPLRVTDKPNALDLCGVFRRTERGYSIKSPLWLSILNRHFTPAYCGRLFTIAGYWNKAIEYYERAIHEDKVDRKSDLFGVTINAMQASENDQQALDILALGLHACYPNCEISIYLRTESILQLVNFQPGKNTGDEPPRKEIQLDEYDSPEVEALLGPDYSIIFRKKKPRFLIPLRVHSGAYAAGLISYTGSLSRLGQHKQHEEILQMISFLHQAARAIDGRRKYSNALQDAKAHTQTLESLDYILTKVLNHLDLDDEVIFRLLLVGLTANECLGFNRAALFLFDDRSGELVGTMGVGHLTWEEADSDWKHFPFHSLDELIAALMVPNYQYSPLHSVVKSIRFLMTDRDMFGKVHREGIARQSTQVAPISIDEIPNSFLYAIEPANEFAVAPLVAGTRRLGLVYVDNKHNHRPIDSFQMASLTGFLTQATLVMEMARSLRVEKQQLEQEKRRLKLEETLRDTSLIIGSSLELKEVLQRILEEMKKVLPFDTASIQLASEETGTLKIIANTGFDDRERVDALIFPLQGHYPNVWVYEKKEPLHFDDIRIHFPHFEDPDYQVTHARGWLGAPLIINDRAIGVITLDSKISGIYTSEHDRLAVLFAGQASVAIENARLFETEKQTREYLDLLIGSSQDGIIAVDNDGWVVRYSEGAQKILGYSLEEIKRKRVDKLYGSLEVARDINKMLLNSDMVRDYQTTIVDSDNNPVPIVLSASLLRDKAGNPIGSVGSFKDMRKLRKVENNLRTILDTVSIMSKVNRSEEGLSALAEKIVTDQPITFCTILLLDESKQNLIVKVAFPNPRALSTGIKWKPALGERISLLHSTLMKFLVNIPEARVFQRGRVQDGTDVVQALQQFVLLDEEIRSALIVPLKAGTDVFGICVLGETRSWSRAPFDDDKVEVVSSMVTQGAIFVDRLQAHEATQNKLIMVERLRSIGEELVAASPGSAKSILNKVVRAARDVTGASSVVIYPWNKQTQTYDNDKIVHLGLTKKKYFSEKIRNEEGSMTGIVVKQGMVIVDDVQKGVDRSTTTPIWAGKGGFLEIEGIHAFVGVSLGTGEDSLGVLFVNFLEPHYFNSSELEAVNLFANQAAIAIENARLYEDLGQRLYESTTLQKMGILLAETRELNVVLDRLMQAAFELIHSDSGNILFYDNSKNEFLEDALISTGVGKPLQPYKTRVRQGNGYSYQIIKSRKPIRIHDTTLDANINPVTVEKGRRAVLGVPLIGRDNPLGVLWVNWKLPRRISEQDERLLMALASQAAVFIENVDLFNKLTAENTRRNEESKALQEVGISLTETIELNKVLYRVMQAALELVDGDEDTILFYDETRDEFDTNALICTGLDQPLQTYETRVRQRAGLAYEIVKDRKPVFISDTLLNPRISQVAIDKGRRATVGVPLLDNDGPVGVLWVNWKAPRQVSSREASLLTALASQATVAIKGARRYEELRRRSAEIQRRSAHLQAVHEAGKVIAAASVDLDRQQILDRILEQAIECVTGVSGSKATVGTIQLLEEETNQLIVRSVFPPDYPQHSIDKFDRISLDLKKNHQAKIGVTGRAALSQKAQLVPDVSKNEDYIAHNEVIKSELAIPLLDNGNVLGVMDVESSELNAFDELDKDSLSLLVDLAVVALRNAEQAEQLSRSNAVGLMGSWGAEIVHDINREVGYIRRDVLYLRQQPGLPEEMLEALSSIDECAEHLALPEIPERLPGYETVISPVSSYLDHAIREAVSAYRSGHASLTIEFEPGSPDVKVAMHERFVLAMVRNLLRNADHALSKIDTKKVITLRSRVEGSMAVLEIEDSGPGLRPELIPYLFKRLIPHQDGRKGRGLLLVGFIVQQHAGRFEIVSNEGGGAFFRFWLPIAEAENTPASAG